MAATGGQTSNSIIDECSVIDKWRFPSLDAKGDSLKFYKAPLG